MPLLGHASIADQTGVVLLTYFESNPNIVQMLSVRSSWQPDSHIYQSVTDGTSRLGASAFQSGPFHLLPYGQIVQTVPNIT